MGLSLLLSVFDFAQRLWQEVKVGVCHAPQFL